jgi:tRNA modification GTPase
VNEADTIVAPATAVARSALAIVRIDGPRSGEFVQRLGGSLPDERVATLLQLTHEGELLDECIATRYIAPRSFTGNDLVELTLHGSPFIVDRVITAIVRLGARVAEPGEFTERAVLNGKLDLVQAESVADLIASRTAVQAKLSLHNLHGLLSGKASAIRDALLFVISRLEAALDFSEDGYEFIDREEARRRVEVARDDVRTIASTYQRGRATATGLSAVILGRPNAGKSTLLNRLVGSERAIVTPLPGTTRDIVRETIEIGGLPVTIADTAGLRANADVVEEIGIARAKSAAREADIVLYLVEGELTDEDREQFLDLPHAIVIRTKIDINPVSDGLGISAATGEGMDRLLALLDTIVTERFAAPEASPTIVNERQRVAVAECDEALGAALESLASGAEEQYVVVDLYRAANALGTLTGVITRDDVLHEIFAKFCIGK